MTARWAALGLALLACNGLLGIEEPILVTGSAGGGGKGGTSSGGSGGASSKAGGGASVDGGSAGSNSDSGGEAGTFGGEGGGGPPDPCGNGEVDTAEQCDDSNEDPTDACTTECRHAVCGDGYVRVFLEECDDGNIDDLDGCTHLCRIERRVHAGGRHSCTIDEFGLKCWGNNEYGQLGQGDTNWRGDGPDEMGAALLPVDLGGDFTPIQVSGNANHTCVLSQQGTVKCFGYNSMGVLGLGHTDWWGDGPNEMGDALPVVDLGTDFVALQVTAGSFHACALSEAGRIKCWGPYACFGGEPGDYRGDEPGDMGDALPYVDLGANFVAAEVGAGSQNTCARSTDGRVKCWGWYAGDGMQGQGHNIELGNEPGELGGTLPFVNLGSDFRVRQLAVGQRHACALGSNGSVKCWGENYQGELGLGDTADRGSGPGQMGDNLPALDLGSDFDVVALECGDVASCARSRDGRLKCWGNNGVGTLGLGDLENRGDQMGEMGDALNAANVGAGLVARDFSLGDTHVCALFTTGGIKCWGWNYHGQLGLGNTMDRGGTPESLGAALPFVVVE